MCGIAGYLDIKLPQIDELKRIGLNMAEAISHRGPDHSGLWFDESLGLVLSHKRLSIIDLSESGNQPMISHSGRYIIVFNGEIYNHIQIRKMIDNNVNGSNKWHGNSDTETLLQAIEIWGLRKSIDLTYVFQYVANA